MAISGGLTHGVTWGLVKLEGPEGLTAMLGIAGLILLITNTLIVSTIVCLIKEGPFDTVGRSVQVRTVPLYLAGGVMANVWARTGLHAPGGVAVQPSASICWASAIVNFR